MPGNCGNTQLSDYLVIRFAILICSALFLFGCKPKGFKMLGSSMAPTIQPGEYISADMSAYKRASPQRWDVIVFNHPPDPAKTFAMRVIGLPGESVSIVSNGVVINGKLLANPRSLSKIKYGSLDYFRRTGREVAPLQLSSNEFFILGDNSTNAADSRYWGPLHRTNIIGRIYLAG